MRFLTWLLGVEVLFMWHGVAMLLNSPAGTLFWIWVVSWSLCGVGALTIALVRVISAKMKAAGGEVPGLNLPRRPVREREE